MLGEKGGCNVIDVTVCDVEYWFYVFPDTGTSPPSHDGDWLCSLKFSPLETTLSMFIVHERTPRSRHQTHNHTWCQKWCSLEVRRVVLIRATIKQVNFQFHRNCDRLSDVNISCITF
jgi:hypothetical protein